MEEIVSNFRTVLNMSETPIGWHLQCPEECELSFWNGKCWSQVADLTNEDLRGEQFDFGVNLSGANLSGANLSDTRLSYADLTCANLSGANLSGVNLTGARLSYADLTCANLSGANLSDADLSATLLREADLSGACLMNTDLTIADLYGAILTGADLSGANLTGVKNYYTVKLDAKETATPTTRVNYTGNYWRDTPALSTLTMESRDSSGRSSRSTAVWFWVFAILFSVFVARCSSGTGDGAPECYGAPASQCLPE